MNEFQLQKLLRKHAGVTESQLADLNHEAVKNESPLEDVVVRHGLLKRDQLYELLANELSLPYLDLGNYMLQPEFISLIPAELAHRLQVIPLFQVNNTVTIATANPDDIGALDQLHQALNMEISPVLVDPDALRDAINLHYGRRPGTAIDDAVMEIEADEALRYIQSEEAAKSIEQLAGEAPVVRFVNTILEQAIADRASDIHVEPEQDNLLIRVRIDGILRESGRFPLRLHAAVASRVKILSGMDISDKRRPQDGRLTVHFDGRQVDIRVSTFPTVQGENVVMRLLDKAAGHLKLPELGLSPDALALLENLVRQPHGMILVTGPTGSGKTTTLYSVLSTINSPEKNIVTIEDPVEYHLPLIRQCQVNVRAGITFASGLRSILRQDPDIVMVGEIRDSETAEIAFQAALTGHLVLSTLHTNDAAGALTRMIDMNVEPFLISSSILAIVAQRLVRRNCDRCRQTYTPAPEVLARLDIPLGTTFSRGTGCPACGNRGYRGRLGIYEILPVSPEIRRQVMEKRSSEEIKQTALTAGMRTMRADALTKVRVGLTTPEEVLRVTQDHS